MQDRVALLPNRYLVDPEDGSGTYYVTLTRADQATADGTLLNKDNLLSDATATALGLTPADGLTVDDAFAEIATSKASVTHATSHASAGSDPVSPSSIGAASVDANSKVTAAEASSYIVNWTGSGTLALANAGKCVVVSSATAATVTIPLYSSVAFPVGTEIEIVQYGAGTVTIVATSGVTLYSAGSATDIAAQYASVALKCIAQDEWLLVGYLA